MFDAYSFHWAFATSMAAILAVLHGLAYARNRRPRNLALLVFSSAIVVGGIVVGVLRFMNPDENKSMLYPSMLLALTVVAGLATYGPGIIRMTHSAVEGRADLDGGDAGNGEGKDKGEGRARKEGRKGNKSTARKAAETGEAGGAGEAPSEAGAKQEDGDGVKEREESPPSKGRPRGGR